MPLLNKIYNLLLLLCLIAFPVLSAAKSPKYEMGSQEACEHIYDALKSFGFYEIGNHQFLKKDYNELYNNFDQFIELMSQDEEFSVRIYDLEKEFLSIEQYKQRYCAAPPSYRDPRVHATKRFNKIYFQFIKEHQELIREKHPDIFAYSPEVVAFLQSMEMLDTMARELFTEIIDILEERRPGIKALVYGKHQELTIISKIVRYEKTEGWGTTPHRDKSCITLIWDSNDDNDDSLLLCEDTQNPSIKKLKKAS